MVQGISESAGVASVIFVLHMATLTILIGMGMLYACFNTNVFYDNVHTPYPDVDDTTAVVQGEGTVLTALFYGFSSVRRMAWYEAC